jgi:hypothetical protein
MPNFDLFERYFKEALAQESGDVQELTRLIFELPENQKVSIVKNRNKFEIEQFLLRGRNALRINFGHHVHFSSSDNNREGKDLLEENSGTEIELKSGDEKTDANIGLSLVSWSVGDPSSSDLSEIMADSMRVRRELFLSGRIDEISKSKARTMDSLVQYFKTRIQVGADTPSALEHLFRCVSIGLTKGVEIQSTYAGAKVKRPLLLQADWHKGLIRYGKGFVSNETIKVVEVARNNERMQVICQGSVSGTKAKLYPHYKNSLSHQGIRIPSENWVNTACFHVWIA